MVDIFGCQEQPYNMPRAYLFCGISPGFWDTFLGEEIRGGHFGNVGSFFLFIILFFLGGGGVN